MVAVQPETQIVLPMSAWVTAGFVAPGVIAGSGSPGRRTAAPGVAVAVGFAVGRAVALGAIALDPGCFALDFGVEAGFAVRVGLAADAGAAVVSTAADAGVEPAPAVAGAGAVPAHPATASPSQTARTKPHRRCGRSPW
jgi:hypothetical protein